MASLRTQLYGEVNAEKLADVRNWFDSGLRCE